MYVITYDNKGISEFVSKFGDRDFQEIYIESDSYGCFTALNMAREFLNNTNFKIRLQFQNPCNPIFGDFVSCLENFINEMSDAHKSRIIRIDPPNINEDTTLHPAYEKDKLHIAINNLNAVIEESKNPGSSCLPKNCDIFGLCPKKGTILNL